MRTLRTVRTLHMGERPQAKVKAAAKATSSGMRAAFTALAVVLAAGVPAAALAQTAAAARTLEFRFTPTARTQIALWIEKPDGTFMTTVGLTQAVGVRGIGNRPGATQMNSGFRWPYGRREGVLPIWAYRRAHAPAALPFHRVIFQNRISEGAASSTSADSSRDSYFCLSFDLMLSGREHLDAVTCASVFNSDKGRFLRDSDVAKGYAEPALMDQKGVLRALDPLSYYPPRRDVTPCTDCLDNPDAATYADHVRQVMPEIDAVTMATPPGGVEKALLFTAPATWPDGDYVAWIEVNVEGDYNTTFNAITNPTPKVPAGAWDSWAMDFGYPYRGQPSVAFRVQFALGAAGTYVTSQPAFYGDVDGLGPAVSAPRAYGDGMITDDPANASGSGADRLRLHPDGDYRFQTTVRGVDMCKSHAPPGIPTGVTAEPVADEKHSHQWGRLAFVVPASEQPIAHYEVRYGAAPITAMNPASFQHALPAVAANLESDALMVPADAQAGTGLAVDFGGMEPLTHYFVAIRAVDTCNVAGRYAVAELTTTRTNFTQLSGCFIATAAYGSALEPQVAAMRAARDTLVPRSALFAAAADLYYRTGPAAAAVVASSAVTRAATRALLRPVADLAQAAAPFTSAR